MKYRIKLMSKDELFITEAEFQALIKEKSTGLTFIPSLKGAINLSSVESILSEELVPKKELTEGYLHDGTKVFKKFGEWKSVYSPDSNLDPQFYPEIVKDEVMSEEEYNSQKLLN